MGSPNILGWIIPPSVGAVPLFLLRAVATNVLLSTYHAHSIIWIQTLDFKAENVDSERPIQHVIYYKLFYRF